LWRAKPELATIPLHFPVGANLSLLVFSGTLNLIKIVRDRLLTTVLRLRGTNIYNGHAAFLMYSLATPDLVEVRLLTRENLSVSWLHQSLKQTLWLDHTMHFLSESWGYCESCTSCWPVGWCQHSHQTNVSGDITPHCFGWLILCAGLTDKHSAHPTGPL